MRQSSLAKTEATFAKVRAFHALIGRVARCPWDTYRAEMVSTYKCDAATLDAMARLGHFHISENTVALGGAR